MMSEEKARDGIDEAREVKGTTTRRGNNTNVALRTTVKLPGRGQTIGSGHTEDRYKFLRPPHHKAACHFALI